MVLLAVLVSTLAISPFTNQAVEPTKQAKAPANQEPTKQAKAPANHSAKAHSEPSLDAFLGEDKELRQKTTGAKESPGSDRMAARKAEHEKMQAQRQAEKDEAVAREQTLKAVNIDPQHFLDVCAEVVKGSKTHDFDTFEYHGPKSDREMVFNLGAYKTGSTSFDAAAQQLGMRACKVGWGDLGPGGDISFQLDGLKWFNDCPVRNDSTSRKECTPMPAVEIFQRAISRCAVVGDAPWPYLYPTLMRAFPKAKFVYTRQKSCSDWIYHVTGLYEAGLSGGPLLPCWYGGELSSKPHDVSWLERCVETERTLVLTAQKLKLPLLVLHASGEKANLNMALVAKFLGKKANPNAAYPHVATPAAHNAHDKLPPADAFDPNFDLWSGHWNGGVPVGDFSRKAHSPAGAGALQTKELKALVPESNNNPEELSRPKKSRP